MLPFAGKAETTWQVEAVDTTGMGKYSSMQIDRDGNIHLAYVIDDGGHALKYACWDKRIRKWFTMLVANESGMCSLALDSKQHPHISFADYGSGFGAKLHHAYWDGSQWQERPIRLDSEIVAYYNSIAFDQNDNPSISFYEYRGPKDSEFAIRLRVVMYNGKYWEVRTVDGDGGSGKFNSMAADAKGGLHIGYGNVSAGDMRYAYWNGSSWALEMVERHSTEAATFLGYSAAIAVDKAGVPHVAYSDPNNRIIKYGVRRDGRWQIQGVEKIHGVAYPDRNSIALDDEGRVYITYYDAGRGELRMAFQDHDRWAVGVVDPNNCGFSSSAQIAGGEIWISYGSSLGAMKVAHTSVSALHEALQATARQMPPRSK